MIRIVAEYIGDDASPYVTEDGALYAVRASTDEEGWSRTDVAVSVSYDAAPGERVYDVTRRTSGQDCDGRTSHTTEATIRPRAGKRQRYYLCGSPRYKRERPPGRFGVRSAFVLVCSSESSRDYSAERAGY
jgi:hypothetical protein